MKRVRATVGAAWAAAVLGAGVASAAGAPRPAEEQTSSAPVPASPGRDPAPSETAPRPREPIQTFEVELPESAVRPEPRRKSAKTPRKQRARPRAEEAPAGTPQPQRPADPRAFTQLPGPATVTGVPDFVIRKFRVPPFLLPIYQAAGIQYGVRWEHLAAINEIETDYGRNLNVSSAGAVGWMQFLPSTWRAYGVDANKDGRKDPYNPVDAIFAAARYLKAAGYEKDIDRAIFAYNHADWYVDSVNLRAKLIAGVPAEVIGSLTGLTEGRFPVYAKARYASSGEPRDRRGIEIYTRRGAPVIAVNDGIVRRIGESERLGRYLVLEDNYGNRYTYGLLAEIEDAYPVPKHDGRDPRTEVRAERARRDPAPDGPASSGAQDAGTGDARHASEPDAAVKTRLFANPGRPRARRAGGAEQLLNADPRYTTYRARLARPFGLGRQDVRLKPLERGARVATGTILGRTGRPDPEAAPHVRFEIRPAGRRSPRIDPKPILDGWKLLEATAVYGASGRNVLHGEDASIGQILLLPKRQLERRVLSDDRIQIYECGRKDVRAGRVDRRVLATLSYLAESGLRPTVTSLICGHSYLTRSGNVSHHSSGSAVDIAAINGVPVLGHQESGGVTHQAVRRLALLQGRMAPDQVISLIDIGGPTLSLADHADHIHVGFRPQVREQPGDGGAYALLEPGVWHDLIERLGEIENPVVRVRPSDAAVPAHRTKRRATSGD